MTTCPVCRDTDELCSHEVPRATALARRAWPWPDVGPSTSYLQGELVAALDAIRALTMRVETLEAERRRGETP